MSNVFTAASPFLAVLRFTGLFPMTFVGPARNGHLRFKWLDAVLRIFWLLIGFISLTVSCLTLGSIFWGQSKILVSAWYLMINVEIIAYNFVLLYQFSKRRNILEFLRLLHKIDDQVSSCFGLEQV